VNSATLVQKLWNYCNVLRDDGMSYGDYVEQLTYLLFLKMADERTKAPYNQKSPVSDKYGWPRPLTHDGFCDWHRCTGRKVMPIRRHRSEQFEYSGNWLDCCQ